MAILIRTITYLNVVIFLNLSSFSFIEEPITHIFPPIYEGLGLPELSNYVEMNFIFTFTMGKKQYNGSGIVRKLIKSKELKIILNKIQGIGPVKENILKNLLIAEVEPLLPPIMNNKQRKNITVYHQDFTRQKD
ncbi:hypothetical protein [Mesobacillus foraminis]|uniref:Uncharacterized protein n=1 Tax=Mesobacillus foraminis TaxID=279826 RepID=A0A4R2BFD9_9BACI|nr:hypothetical protein [Mesobacillus foraminis]TCN25042.1 hypothetical protein EV146_106244 [Mesobacillus foraminis]